LFDDDTPDRAEMLLALSEALRYHGEPDRAREVQQIGAAVADRIGGARLRGRAVLGRAGLPFSFDPDA
jgi:hypothetical protein